MTIRAPLIRDAREGDIAAVQTIYGFHVRHGLASFEEVAPALAEMRARYASLRTCGFPYLVAEGSGEILGYAYASEYRSRTAYRFTLEDSVYVADGHQGCGIGNALLGALVVRCEAGPWRQMVAIIGDSANAGSIALHRRNGFRPVGTLTSVGFKKGKWIDTVFMQRPLGKADMAAPD